jgi:hypothetical protein
MPARKAAESPSARRTPRHLAQPGIDPPVRDGSRFGYPSYELLLIHRIVAKVATAKQSWKSFSSCP